MQNKVQKLIDSVFVKAKVVIKKTVFFENI